MKLLLTGAAGFVASHVQAVLPCIPMVENGKEVEIREPLALREFIARVQPEAVLHLAAQSFVPASFREPRETFEINFLGTYNLLSALADTGFNGKVLFIGSSDEYGLVPADRLPITEDCPLRPRNPYAVSKVAAEALAYQYSQTSGFQVIMVRPFNHIGPGQNDSFVVADFARQIAEIKLGRREPVIHIGDVDVTRDFTDVRDVVRAYAMLLEQGKNGEVYNVCSGVERSIRELLSSLVDLAEVKTRVQPAADRFRASEQRRVCGSCEKLRRDTGWEPQFAMQRTLTDILTFWERKTCQNVH